MSHLHESELLVLQAETPADRSRLRTVIDLALRLEKLSAGRIVLVGVLAFLGAPLWILTVWPNAMPHWHIFFVLSWLAGAIGLGAVILAESDGRRRLRRLANRPIDGEAAMQAATPPSA